MAVKQKKYLTIELHFNYVKKQMSPGYILHAANLIRKNYT